MEKRNISGHAETGLIAWELLMCMGMLMGNFGIQADSLLKFELKTPEPRIYWVEPSSDMLSPGMKSPVSTLELRSASSDSYGAIIDHRLILHLVEGISIDDFIKPWGLELFQSLHFPGVHVVAASSPYEALNIASAWADLPKS